jgi:hypothetical protein
MQSLAVTDVLLEEQQEIVGKVLYHFLEIM